jgi:DNA-binding beta-propeller fold protein YncE
MAAGILAAWASAGCGGSGNKTANQVAVSVTGAASVLVPKQSEVLTAVVTGATDVSSDFKCTFTTTPDPTTTTPTPKPSDPKPCEDPTVAGKVGVLSNIQNSSTTVSSTATFTAPDAFPDHATFPNVVVTITATAHANTKKTGTFPIAFDSGVRITITPTTATLATGEQKQFFAKDFNGNLFDNADITWGLTFEQIAKVDSATCSGGSNDCGSIDASGNYTAPGKVPTAATQASGSPAVNAAGIVTVFVFSKVDNKRIAQGAITIVTGGPITFGGLSPVAVPLGGPFADIFLNAPNITSQSGILLTPPPPRSPTTIDPTNSNQIKVVFAAGSTSSSIGARVRLLPANIPVPGTYSIQITPGGTATVTGGPFTFEVKPVAPSLVNTFPDNFQEQNLVPSGTPVSGSPAFTINGGYFGAGANPIVSASFNNSLLLPVNISPRSFSAFAPSISGGFNSGLFPVSITNSTGPSPLTAYTSVAVIPDYGGSNPVSLTSTPALGAGSVPSAIALDSVLGVGAVTLAGVNDPGGNPITNSQPNVQFFSVAGGTVTLTGTASSGGNVATGVAVDDQLHIAAVVNYASRTLGLVNLPGGSTLAAPVTIDLSGIIPPPNPPSSSFTEPFPYSVGIDPFLHRAVVAFASTNLGLIVNIDGAATVTCVLGTGPYCPVGYVALSTGAHPQIAFEPLGHIAYVTPGGGGVLEGVDLSALSGTGAPVNIKNISRVANLVTVTTAADHHLAAGVPVIGTPTVLITNVPPGKNGTNFNGAFPVTSVLSSTVFTYAQAVTNDTVDCTTVTPPNPPCSMSQGTVSFAFSLSPSLQGIAVNPITRHLALVNPNLQVSQVGFLDPLTRIFQSMSIFKDAVGAVFSGAPEIGETAVGFQPFTNTAVVFNPTSGVNQVSVIDPSLFQRPAFINTLQQGNGTVTYPSGANPIVSGLQIPGSLAVDAIGNQGIAVNAGSGNLSVIKLGNIKPVHIQELRTPDVPGTTLRNAALTSPAAPLASLPGVKIFGTGFTGASQVRLDGVPLSSGFTVVSDHEIDLTIAIPPALVGVPHRYAVDVVTGSVFSNSVAFSVIGVTAIPDCSAGAAKPGGVAIDEQRNLAVVTNTACAQVSLISLNPAGAFGAIVGSIATGGTPTGVAIQPRLSATVGVAVVTNNSSNSVSILDLDQKKQLVTDLTVGTQPTGVAINPQTNLAVIANTGSNSVSTIDLSPLVASPVGTLSVVGPVGVDQNPIAVAIDPDRGSNGRGLAVVSALQFNSTSNIGVLDAIDIGGTVPARSTSAASALFLSSPPSGVFFDPVASSGGTNPGLFFGVTSQSNQVLAFNPDTGASRPISVGINPKSVALNSNSGSLITVNGSSNTVSLVDAQTFQTKELIGVGGNGLLAVAVHNFLNLAVIVDQDNNRVFLLPLP